MCQAAEIKGVKREEKGCIFLLKYVRTGTCKLNVNVPKFWNCDLKKSNGDR